VSCGSAGQHSQVAAGRAQQSSVRALPNACSRFCFLQIIRAAEDIEKMAIMKDECHHAKEIQRQVLEI